MVKVNTITNVVAIKREIRRDRQRMKRLPLIDRQTEKGKVMALRVRALEGLLERMNLRSILL